MTLVARGQGRNRAYSAHPSAIDHLETRVGKRIKRQPDGCWIYGNDPDKYQQINSQPAHRWVYELLKGVSLGSGIHLHHKCQRPACVNPEHLEPLTPKEHVDEHMRLDGRVPVSERVQPEPEPYDPYAALLDKLKRTA